MKFFLSYESAAPAASYLTKLEPLFSAKLAALEPKNYGDDLTDIGIISIVLPEELLPNHPERQLFQRKSRSADIRLQMDFAAFVHTKPETRYELYAAHILASLSTLERKVARQFQYAELYRDVEALLCAPDLRAACSQITRLP